MVDCMRVFRTFHTYQLGDELRDKNKLLYFRHFDEINYVGKGIRKKYESILGGLKWNSDFLTFRRKKSLIKTDVFVKNGMANIWKSFQTFHTSYLGIEKD